MLYFIFMVVAWILIAGSFAIALAKLADFLEWAGKAYDSFNERFIKAKPKANNNKALS